MDELSTEQPLIEPLIEPPPDKSSSPIYVVNYGNDVRRYDMIQRVAHLLPGVRVHFSPGLSVSDPIFKDLGAFPLRTWAVVLDHLANIRHFYESNKPYGLFCEDDLMVHRDLSKLLPQVYKNCMENNWDVCLLASLLLEPPPESSVVGVGPTCDQNSDGVQVTTQVSTVVSTEVTTQATVRVTTQVTTEVTTVRKYYTYTDDMWGAHMYVLSREYARYLLEKYTLEWAQANPTIPFCSDWTITKDASSRVLLYPPLGVEEGSVGCDDWSQIQFHRQSHLFMYDPRFYV